jgi:hypothetical protein
MKLNFRIEKILTDKGERAVIIRVEVKDPPNYGGLTEVLYNNVFQHRPGVFFEESDKIVNNLFESGNSEKGLFLVKDDNDIKKIIGTIVTTYNKALAKIKENKDWYGTENLEHKI